MTTNMIRAARDQVAQLTQQAYEKAAAAGALPGGQTITGTVEVPKDSRNGDLRLLLRHGGGQGPAHGPPGHRPDHSWTIWSWRAPSSTGRRSPGRAS